LTFRQLCDTSYSYAVLIGEGVTYGGVGVVIGGVSVVISCVESSASWILDKILFTNKNELRYTYSCIALTLNKMVCK
jgi:hypothetical protein